KINVMQESKELERFNQDTIVYSGSDTRTPSCPTPLPESPTREFVNTSHQSPLTSVEASQHCLHLLTDSSHGRITPTLQYLVYNEDESNYNYYMMYKNQKYDLDNAVEMRNKVLGA
ncbi:hypothetical protein Tco_1119262, partial [Tanacetum coccineum]